MKQSPAWIRHHILALESANLVEVSEIRKTGKVTEKFYRAKADALLLQEVILPKTKKPALIFSGSHDLALEGIAENLQKHVTLLACLLARWMDLSISARDYAKFPAHICWMKLANTTYRLSVTYSQTATWKLSRLPTAHRE